MIKWSDDSAADSVAIVEECVKVWQKSIANIESFSARNGHRVWPLTGILIFEDEAVVITREGIKSAQFHPALAHFFLRVEVESANIRPDVWYVEHVELDHSCVTFWRVTTSAAIN